MHRQWLVNRTNPEFLKFLSVKTAISPILAQILVNRGIKDQDAITKFLNPSLDQLHDPFLLHDMGKGVERLKKALDSGETVFVHGDYDADGITGTALLVSILTRLGIRTSYHVPNRINEGYGLSLLGIQKAKECGAGLIITVDCGISSEAEVMKARELDMDVIVADHHEPPEHLPEAVAVIDPHRAGSAYPFKYLAGVGVAFKFAQAFLQSLGKEDLLLEEGLDLVALGTIADSVPLTDENRVFATFGLRQINRKPGRVGLEMLRASACVDGDIRSSALSYTIIPRINAAGRIDDAGEVVKLLLSDDRDEAGRIARLLESQNRERQRIEGAVLKDALERIGSQEQENAIVLSSDAWHPGVIGIVASRLVEMFYRPVFLFSINGSVARGSARSIPQLHLVDSIAACSELLLAYGGHRQAAGLSIRAENLTAFQSKIRKVIQEKLEAGDMTPLLEIDAAIDLSDVSFELIRELSMLEPFGYSNRQPLFGAKDITIVSQRVVGNNHLKMQLRQARQSLDSIGFSMGKMLEKLESSPAVDIAFHPCLNEWNGMRNLQLNLQAIRPSNYQPL